MIVLADERNKVVVLILIIDYHMGYIEEYEG